MQIGKVKRVRLGIFPTPLQELRALSEELGGPRIFVKRDDLNGLALGGNKLRKLEYAMAEARDLGATAIITTGRVQSNHCRLTAAAANLLGMKTYLILVGEEPEMATGNLLVDKILGVEELRYVEGDSYGKDSPLEEAVRELSEELSRRGEVPYYIPNGCRPLHGALGYAGCVRETVSQLHELNLAPDWFVVACGTTGTCLGLLLGSHLYCHGEAKVVGISISRPADFLNEKLEKGWEEATGFLEIEAGMPGGGPRIHDEYVGKGYGIPTPEGVKAIRLLARLEGLILDPVYTGKAMAGLIDLAKQGLFAPGDVVVFVHTGGIPGLFADHQIPYLQ
jgi:D-cysteine desulfhydrase family pyridoxal phosphate-dependent enzyme